MNTITEQLRYGWPTQITVTIRDQYGDAIVVPELKVNRQDRSSSVIETYSKIAFKMFISLLMFLTVRFIANL